MRIKRPFMLFCILIIVVCIAKHYIGEKILPPRELPETAVTLQGRIDAWEVRNERTILYLSEIYFYGDSAKEINNYNSIGVRCYVKAKEDFKLGQAVAVQGFLTLPESARNPGEFDANIYYKSKGYDYVMYEAEILSCGEKFDYMVQGLDEVRRYAQRQLERYLIPEDAGIMSAMLLGDKSLMETETKELYREVGIYHILAISGLHISMIGGCIYKLLKKLQMKPVAAVVISLIFIIFYGVMIGMPPSAFRAIVMFAFGLVAPIFYRSHDKLTSLAFAGACLAVWEPVLMFDAGVQLSFLAVMGIVLLYPTFLDIHRHHMKVADGLWVSFAVTYMTVPVIMRTYYEVPLYSLLANVCVLPFVPVLIGLGLVISIFGGIWSFPAKLSAMVIHMILWFYERILAIFAGRPGNSYVTGAPEIWRIVVFYIVLGIMIWIILKVKRKLLIQSLYSENDYAEGRPQEYIRVQKSIRITMIRVRMAQITIMILLIVIFALPERFDCRITFLDVGQGDGVCIETGEEIFLIDCGSTSKEHLGKYTLMPFLKYRGIDEIDGWFLTHPDMDHTSAFREMCENDGIAKVSVSKLYIPKKLEKEFGDIITLAKKCGIEVMMLDGGEVPECEEIKITVLSPDIDLFYPDENAASLVLYVECGKYDALFMGDAGVTAERSIVRQGIEDVTLLKVGHHGSAIEANTKEFIQVINPAVAVISCGENNVYGHPHTDVTEYLASVESMIVRTDYSGAVTIEMQEGGLKIYSECEDGN